MSILKHYITVIMDASLKSEYRDGLAEFEQDLRSPILDPLKSEYHMIGLKKVARYYNLQGRRRYSMELRLILILVSHQVTAISWKGYSMPSI